MTKMISVQDADTLVDERGEVRLGYFSESLQNVNGRDALYRSPLGYAANRFQKHFHYKQFQYFGIISDELMAGCAFADTAWLGMAFFYLFNPRTGSLREFTWRSPFARSLDMSQSVLQGESCFRQGDVDIRMRYRSETPVSKAAGLIKELELKAGDIHLHATMKEETGYQPMSICTRAGVSGFVYANKVAARPVHGFLKTETENINLADIEAWGHHDFSAGYMRRETFWNWACLSGKATTDLGKPLALGLNISCGVNETTWSENCFWVDNQLTPLSGTHFIYDRANLLAPWNIRTTDEMLALDFTPSGNHEEKMNLGLFASNFNQIFGTFSGSIQLPQSAGIEGKRILVKDMPGFVEEQYAKW